MLEGMESVLRYIEVQTSKALAMEGMSEAEMLSMLNGNGGPVVHAVLYLASHGNYHPDAILSTAPKPNISQPFNPPTSNSCASSPA